ncbi:STE/STE20 protein kinase [Nannizzia gypsea CBS 118893]|uniref:STE/STE20 protein kinase n=1 Tax=Arthroderma gypseum (strain ATCC MYA-4604 / CBS 118893) TaxID=535722 RepID=E5R276_ARTGP|nr:STE/STE20 protein kinase [Nannizzia gypsea CBS 118893]EFQ98640.1 STE/STE20 protein kinase [Nannizzia gypsea CBS 118893]
MASSLPLLKLGQSLKGTLGAYTIAKQLSEFTWLGRNAGHPVVIKSARHFRIANERDVLRRFQARTHLRPLIDEIVDPAGPPAIVLKHLDDDLLNASNTKKLNTKEIKHVSKCILEALDTLHADGYVHTDIKIDNILVNYALPPYSDDKKRFTDVQLADLESTVHVTSRFCRNRDGIGTAIWRSPEAQMGLQWGPPTDIWSFGAVVISLIWGDNFLIFKPKLPDDHDGYELEIIAKNYIYFGPFPEKFVELTDQATMAALANVIDPIPAEKLKPFARASRREIPPQDREFVLKVMKLDPRDRPTAKELLKDKWFDSI